MSISNCLKTIRMNLKLEVEENIVHENETRRNNKLPVKMERDKNHQKNFPGSSKYLAE